jgi:hypothetical protein
MLLEPESNQGPGLTSDPSYRQEGRGIDWELNVWTKLREFGFDLLVNTWPVVYKLSTCCLLGPVPAEIVDLRV